MIRYGSETEPCISQLEELIHERKALTKDSLVRWHAIKLLEGDAIEKQQILERFPEKGPRLVQAAEECRQRIFDLFQDDFEIVLTEDRYGVIAGILRETVTNTAKKRIDMSRNIDLVLTDRFLGIPVFIFFIWVMFQTTFALGAYPMAWIESGVTVLTVWLDHLLSASLFKSMLLDGVVAGIGSVIVFLPNILILFFLSPCLRIPDIWPGPRSSWTGSCIQPVFMENPLFPCSWDSDAMCRPSWRPGPWNTRKTGFSPF